MKYCEIVNKKQYQDYSKRHLELGNTLGSGKKNSELEREYYILDLVIEDYHSKQVNPFTNLTPVDLLKALLKEHKYTGYKLHKELGISQSVISEILKYKRGFSKDVIRKLAKKFDVREEAFLKEYVLKGKLEIA